METASVSHDEEPQHAVISFADGAKVRQNSEITKLSSKKELPPVTPLGTNRRGISKAAQTILAPRPFHQEDQPTVVPGRGTASLNQKEGSPADIPHISIIQRSLTQILPSGLPWPVPERMVVEHRHGTAPRTLPTQHRIWQ